MYRVSIERTHLDTQFHLRQREYQLNRIQNHIASQRRILSLRDDPAGASHVTRLESRLNRLEQFATNSQFALDTYQYNEGYVRESIDIVQRVRELAVQAATGTYAPQDRALIAVEVEEYLSEMVRIANTTSPTGTALFGGTRINANPYEVLRGRSEGGDAERIVAVSYRGNIESRHAEVAERSYMDLDIPGNRLFWAQNQQIFSNVDPATYQATEDSQIRIDGVAIEISVGDNIGSIIAKINNSAAAVRASLDPVRNGLLLESTQPHQIWLEENGTVLQELGILAEGGAGIAPTAESFGGSLFDALITFRDALERNDIEAIGGQVLQGVGESLNNLLTNVASLGAKSSRAQLVQQQIQYEITEIGGDASQLRDIDFTEAVTELRTREHTHQAALAAAGRILPRTLLDFLR